MQRTLLAAVAALGFLSLAAPANAEEFAIRVGYSDLDLSTQRGADRLISRIERAARTACLGTRGRVSLEEIDAARECTTDVLERGVAMIDDSRVNARFAERQGRQTPVRLASR